MTLTSVWNDDKVKEDEDEGKKDWQCLWCSRFFNPKYATRALCYLLQIGREGIAICKVLIPPLYVERYQALHDLGVTTAEYKKQGLEEVHDHAATRQLLAVTQLTQKRSKMGTDSAASSSNSLGFNTAKQRHPYVKPNAHPPNQQSIVASV